MGKRVSGFKADLDATCTALLYTIMPGLLFIWLTALPAVGLAFGVILDLWETVLAFLLLSGLQRTRTL